MIDRRDFLAGSAAVGLGSVASLASAGQTGGNVAALATAAIDSSVVPVTVDVGRIVGELPHIWAESAGSDRAASTLRESWRNDLDRWSNEAGLKRVRFHGIFADELGVYAPSILNRNRPTVNWQNVDQVYDGLVERNVEPLIELSFMPKALASGDATFGFYRANITPPRVMEDWAAFIRQFTVHLVDRYGIETVRRWPFEVWNEPNLPFFWTGTQAQYFDLYRATALAVKSVDSGLQVGGPATSGASWIPELADFCSTTNTPIDFFATHAYAGDAQRPGTGQPVALSTADVIPEAMRRARAAIDASPLRGRPLWLTEWSSDSPAMIAHIILNCLPHCQLMSQWVMSSTYEELGVANYRFKEGDMGFGMLVDDIARPSFNTYRLLHALGTQRLAATGPVLATTGASGVSALVWNLADVTQPSGIPGMTAVRTVRGETKRLNVAFAGARRGQPVRIRFVDQDRASPMPAWRAMGSPQYLTVAQRAELRRAAEIAPPTIARLGAGGSLNIDLPPEGVALIELPRRS